MWKIASKRWVIMFLFVLVGSRFMKPVQSYQKSHARELKRSDTVAVFVALRNYLTGPIEDHFAILNHDSIGAYVGPLNPDFIKHTYPDATDPKRKLTMKGSFRTWAMIGINEDGYQQCELQSIHDYGQYAFFVCPESGVYRIFSWDKLFSETGEVLEAPSTTLTGGDPILVWNTIEGRKYYELFASDNKYGQENIFHGAEISGTGSSGGSKTKNELTTEDRYKFLREIFLQLPTSPNKNAEIAMSDPIYVEESKNCYYWMYRTEEKARVGYVADTEVSPGVGTDGNSYLVIDLLIWIGEPNAVGVEEAQQPLSKMKISEYSRMLTRRYFTLGLFPCLRKAHLAMEITKDITFVVETDQDNRLQSPHWKATLKIHTDRLLTTLSDISFTIAGRQNAALFGCFVGDTRVFINTKTFQFVSRTRLDRLSMNLKLSKLKDAFLQKIKYQITQIFGHGVQFIGHSRAKYYQPATSRTDLVVINNPCIAQEFAIAVGGSLYVAEGLLSEGIQLATKVYIPGLDDTNAPGKTDQKNRYYIRILDVAFTPTHFVMLLDEGIVILHPTSIRQKGIGRMSNTQKHRLKNFVKRRWCGRTSTPKLSNMIVPGFSGDGRIVIIQVFPIEGSVHMWVNPASQFCLPEGQKFTGKAEILRKSINETEIHYNEYVSVNRSDDRGIRIPTPLPRPEPQPPQRNRDEDASYLINNGTYIEQGQDPHFPPELANPASQVIGENLENYNSAVIYVMNSQDNNKLKAVLQNNDLDWRKPDLQAVEFTAVEKQFIIGLKFSATVIDSVFTESLQMMITTMTATNLPSIVKIPEEEREQDETLDTIVPFPGVLLVRLRAFQLPVVPSRDFRERREDSDSLSGQTEWEFVSKIFPVSTALPSYVVDLGNALLFTSLDGRYARPLYFFNWCSMDTLLNPRGPHASNVPCKKQSSGYFRAQTSDDDSPPPPELTSVPRIYFNQSTPIFYTDRIYDVVVTAQGIISVLWRKDKRHIVQDDQYCLATDDSDRPHSIAIGSVLINDGLREIHPFFQNDNIFQMASPDGEIIYGNYDVRPHSPFSNCYGLPNETTSEPELCIQQAKVRLPGQEEIIYVCSKETADTGKPCRDPGYIQKCPPDGVVPDTKACIRFNDIEQGIDSEDNECKSDGRDMDDNFQPPKSTLPKGGTRKRQTAGSSNTGQGGAEEIETVECYKDTAEGVTKCWPRNAPREELRSINILGTTFYGYLHGSLKSVRSVHPEAPTDEPEDENDEESDVCPFVGFSVYNVDFDFAEVGYQTRISGHISYLGKGIPTEADLLVEFEATTGVIVEVSSSVEVERDLTTITKVIDITFVLTDYQLEEIRGAEHDFSEENFYAHRAREKSSTFSLTLRPSIVNMYCKNSDYFKTIHFSVGCNTFSNIRLISEAAPFHRLNLTDSSKIPEHFRWKVENDNLIIPKSHVFHLQVKEDVFNCSIEEDTKCRIPFFELFRDNIFTTSYRDFFFPKFEQFLTVSSRRVTGNMVLYDLMGSKEFNVTVNNLQAKCYSTGDSWYDQLRNSTDYIYVGTSEHEYIYRYYRDCFNNSDPGKREQSQTLDATPFYLFNLTNHNMIKFRRQRNQIFIFRAVVLNTEYNRFTYCKTLETFFLVRITGIPIPRQGLALWIYIIIIFIVVISLLTTYMIFFQFYTWKLDSTNSMPSNNKDEDKE